MIELTCHSIVGRDKPDVFMVGYPVTCYLYIWSFAGIVVGITHTIDFSPTFSIAFKEATTEKSI